MTRQYVAPERMHYEKCMVPVSWGVIQAELNQTSSIEDRNKPHTLLDVAGPSPNTWSFYRPYSDLPSISLLYFSSSFSCIKLPQKGLERGHELSFGKNTNLGIETWKEYQFISAPSSDFLWEAGVLAFYSGQGICQTPPLSRENAKLVVCISGILSSLSNREN